MEARDMMGRKSGQIEMLLFNPEDIIPKNHILRKIEAQCCNNMELPSSSPHV